MSKQILAKLVVAMGAMFVAMSVTACNTTKGAGRDMERVGEKVQDAAEDAKH